MLYLDRAINWLSIPFQMLSKNSIFVEPHSVGKNSNTIIIVS